VTREHGRDARVRFDRVQQIVERRPGLLEMGPRAGPLRHDGSEEVERTDRDTRHARVAARMRAAVASSQSAHQRSG
jgi:hypothetical protein